MLGRGSRHGDQAVDGNALRRWVKRTEHLEHSQAVVFGFAHADNASAADTHAGALNGADGIQAIFEGVRADDLRIISEVSIL